jgi:tRNA(Arg) A34 adenosine deaminase TadA
MSDFASDILVLAMQAALAEARAAKAAGELPYGAVIVSPEGRIVARAQDTVARDRDPTRHAEIAAVRAAIAAIGPDLRGHALVSTTEACAMCSSAAWWAGIGTHAYGLSQITLKALRPDALDEPMLPTEVLFASMSRPMRVIPGVMAEACRELWN